MAEPVQTMDQWADDLITVLDALELAELCLTHARPIPEGGAPVERTAALLRVFERLAGDPPRTDPEGFAEHFRQAQAKRAEAIAAATVALLGNVSTAIARTE